MPEKKTDKQQTDNMELWDRQFKTPKKHTKKVEFGKRKFTNINSQYQIGEATREWGPYGNGWSVKDLVWGEIRNAEGELIEVTLDATFAYPQGSFPISSCTAYRAGNDTRKKLLTDLTTKALSKLGFSADIFLGCYDDNKYLAARQAEQDAENAGTEPPQEPYNENNQPYAPQAEPPQQPAEPPQMTVAQRLKTLLGKYGKEKCTAAKMRLIHPSGTHFTDTDPVTKMGDVSQIERFLEEGGE